VEGFRCETDYGAKIGFCRNLVDGREVFVRLMIGVELTSADFCSRVGIGRLWSGFDPA
jgi:hypothetical protein